MYVVAFAPVGELWPKVKGAVSNTFEKVVGDEAVGGFDDGAAAAVARRVGVDDGEAGAGAHLVGPDGVDEVGDLRGEVVNCDGEGVGGGCSAGDRAGAEDGVGGVGVEAENVTGRSSACSCDEGVCGGAGGSDSVEAAVDGHAVVVEGGKEARVESWADVVAGAMDTVCGAGAGGKLGPAWRWEGGGFHDIGIERGLAVGGGDPCESCAVEEGVVVDDGVVAFTNFVAKDEVASSEHFVPNLRSEIDICDWNCVRVFLSVDCCR